MHWCFECFTFCILEYHHVPQVILQKINFNTILTCAAKSIFLFHKILPGLGHFFKSYKSISLIWSKWKNRCQLYNLVLIFYSCFYCICFLVLVASNLCKHRQVANNNILINNYWVLIMRKNLYWILYLCY